MRAAVSRIVLAALLTGASMAAARPPSPGSPEADIFGLGPELESFIDARVRRNQPRSARLRNLLDAVFGKDGLGISYGALETKTPSETFATRSGNCLSFTILFVALARHVGLQAHFQEVSEILSWDRRGDVAVINRHMFAEVETADGTARVDFLPGVEKRYRSVRRVGERRVLAHYYSNVGAEALTAAELDRALELFARALEADDKLAAAWVNRGVALRRLGRLEEAEASYRRALEIDPNEISASSNLASLYRASGRDRQAGPFLKKVQRYQERNPFYHFRQAVEAVDRGQLRLAQRTLRRAIRLMPEEAMFRAELGRVRLRLGRPRQALRSFRKAVELADDEAQRARLAGLVEKARAGGS